MKSLGNSSEFYLLSSEIKILNIHIIITELLSCKRYKCLKLTNSFDERYLSNEISKMVQSCFINVVISTDRFPSCWILEHWLENSVFVKRLFSIYKLEREVNFHPVLHITRMALKDSCSYHSSQNCLIIVYFISKTSFNSLFSYAEK